MGDTISLEDQMATKSKNTKQTSSRIIPIPGLQGVRVVRVKNGDTKLELRQMLGMPREVFGRLVDVSTRTIADVEATQKKVEKLRRNYIEVSRLCDILSEVVDRDCLGEWFRTPNDALDGFKPIEVIERGEIDRLWDLVYRLRSGMPG
jgi:DNA-binding XRE family transcriptional regulator